MTAIIPIALKEISLLGLLIYWSLRVLKRSIFQRQLLTVFLVLHISPPTTKGTSFKQPGLIVSCYFI